MRQGALPRRRHGTGSRRSPSPRSARARSRSAGGGAHPPRPTRALARPRTLSAKGRASGVLGDSSLGSLLPPDPPKRATVRAAGIFPSWVSEPRCQAVPAPRSPRLALSRPPPGPRRARAGSCLPETCPAVCACVCLSESLPLHHSARGRDRVPGDQLQSGCQSTPSRSLPTHPAPTPRPPPPPRCSSSSRRSRAPKGGEKPQRKGRRRVGKEAQVSSVERGALTPGRLAEGGGQGSGGEGGGGDLPRGRGPAAEPPPIPPGRGSCGPARRWGGGRAGLPRRLRPKLGEPAEVTRVAEPRNLEVGRTQCLRS